MIPNTLISYYIDRLTLDDGLNLAKKHGVIFSRQEGQIILKFIKENKHLISLKNRRFLEEKIKKVVEPTTYDKIDYLLKKYLD